MNRNFEKGIENLKKLNHWRRYQSTLSFILYVALRRQLPKARLIIEHSMSKGLYFVIEGKLPHSELWLIEKEMKRIIENDYRIERITYSRNKARAMFKKRGLDDKVVLLNNLQKKSITLYSLLNTYDMFATEPFESTGEAPLFSLEEFPPGYIMMVPMWQDITQIPKYVPQPKLTRIFNEYEEWARLLGINNVGQLNNAIQTGKGPEIVKVSEALHEKKIVYIADRIVREKRKIILIAGPSGAGKTTFTKRLAIQLIVNGIRPLIISADDYFLPHSETPRDESGLLDFESLKAVDLPLLNEHLLTIIDGKKVRIPRFNFLSGRRNQGMHVQLPEGGVILLEGIHCLNEQFTYRVPKSIKFKIYISALTQLNIDDHNRISTTDTRMLRRIVRDTYFRGYQVREILQHWGSVRNGEEKNIYPFQEEADEMFNSALLYEPAVVRKFCLPIIQRIKKDHPEYEETKRLVDFLTFFYELDERDVPSNSILREFIGGSSFVY